MAEAFPEPRAPLRVIGRYALYDPIAAGGMATVHLGRLLGPVGFSRTVAIKRSHPEFAADPEFVSMFLDEARLAARIRHPNVVQTVDVVALDGELFLVMDFVQGESLSKLSRATRAARRKVPCNIACAIMAGVLRGLHAAHEAKNERGEPLGLVHRDVSPQNVIVGVDGIARVLDFGVAKAAGRVQTTRDGQIKGKIAYLAPEQLHGEVSRQSDVYAAAVVLWETLTGDRLFSAENPGELLTQVLNRPMRPPSEIVPELPVALDEIVLRGLERTPAARYPTARDMALAIERAVGLASSHEVGEWVEMMAKDALELRARKVAELETYAADEYDFDTGSGARPAARALARSADRFAISDSERGDEPTRLEANGPLSPRSRSMATIRTDQVGENDHRGSLVRAAVAFIALAGIALAGWLFARARPPAPAVEALPAASRALVVIPRGGDRKESELDDPTSSSSVPQSSSPPAGARPEAPGSPSAEPLPAPSTSTAPASEAAAGTPSDKTFKPAAGRGRSTSPAKKKRDCASPYFVDADGIRHILPECLK